MQQTFGAIDRLDLIVHANINKFVSRALDSVPGFGELSYEEQSNILQGYAREFAAPRIPIEQA
jgi:hypothetical protein